MKNLYLEVFGLIELYRKPWEMAITAAERGRCALL